LIFGARGDRRHGSCSEHRRITILLHPPGKKNGVTIIMLATSLDSDIRSANDVGVKGESAEILRSFRLE
jgi:hypothetical protein